MAGAANSGAKSFDSTIYLSLSLSLSLSFYLSLIRVASLSSRHSASLLSYTLASFAWLQRDKN